MLDQGRLRAQDSRLNKLRDELQYQCSYLGQHAMNPQAGSHAIGAGLTAIARVLLELASMLHDERAAAEDENSVQHGG